MIECSETYEYEFEDNDNRSVKTVLYPNDLKYIEYNKIDLNKVKDLPNDYDFSTLQSRIDACIKSDHKMLDISHLNLTQFPSSVCNLSKLQYLFMSHNKISKINDLSFYKDLIVIDLSYNNLTAIPLLPNIVEELVISHNNIENATLKYNYLKRLDISNNKLISLSFIESLEILNCDDNKLTKIDTYPQLKKLSCERNNISVIHPQPKLRILYADNNKIKTILNFPKLKELFCNDNNIVLINKLDCINILSCIHNKLNTIEFFPTLKELVCDFNDNVSLSNEYAIKNSKVYKDYICIIFQ